MPPSLSSSSLGLTLYPELHLAILQTALRCALQTWAYGVVNLAALAVTSTLGTYRPLVAPA